MRLKLLSLLIALGILSLSAAGKYQYDNYYYQRATLFEVLPVDSADIVMLGNSITNGGDWHEIFNLPNIKNRGIISDIIQGMYDRVDPYIAGHPKKLFLLGGVNDISHHLSADSIASAIGKLCDYIMAKSPSTKLYLQSVFPFNNSFKRYRNLIGTEQVQIDLNRILVEMAAKKGITYIDVVPALVDEEGNLRREFTADGLHLNTSGYKAWAEVLAPHIGLVSEPLYSINPGDIVIVGGSLVSGCEWFELLENSKVKKRTNGDNCATLTALVEQVAKAKPAQIVITAEYSGLKGDINEADILASVRKSLDAVRTYSPESQVVLVGLSPINSSYKGYEAYVGKEKQIREINAKLKKLAGKYGVAWIDLFPQLAKKNQLAPIYTNDGFHLMGVGYLKWRNLLFKYISPEI